MGRPLKRDAIQIHLNNSIGTYYSIRVKITNLMDEDADRSERIISAVLNGCGIRCR